MKLPRFMIAAAASGSGKTLFTCGILQALMDRGLRPASFKCGPDFIDPMFHTTVLGTKSRNLDTFFTGETVTRYLLAENAKDADIAVMEGVMGYYDGLAGISTKASAYDLADTTGTPVLFLANAKGMSVSLIPYLKGFIEYKEESHIEGIILNRISPMLYPRIRRQIESELGVRVYGYIPELPELALESRHLGLVQPDEVDGIREKLHQLAAVLRDTLDLEGILSMAAEAPSLWDSFPGELTDPAPVARVRVALARDEAFSFIYEDNLRLLRALGAEIVPFSPLRDAALPPDIQGLLLYGGYPELHARQLSENASMRQSIRDAVRAGLPCIAECGGFLYLHEELEDMQGTPHPMVGIFPAKGYRTPKLTRFGYITLTGDAVFGGEAGSIPAHEFHYFDSTAPGEAMTARKPLSRRTWSCMYATDTLLAGFPHIYYYGNPQTAVNFLRRCASCEKCR